ncbi:MAG: hypothetical protein SOV36_03175 [Anaerostipes faecalis]|nr:hypothetical protein [Anaerostipes faecalis]
MNKPNDYDKVQPYGEFMPLELGGHILVIKGVEETKSRAGMDMLMIYLDTAPEDRQPNYYKKQFADDIRPNKKWGCIVYQLVYDGDGATNRGLKTFHTCVEKSNPGFSVNWGPGYADCFKGKKIGGVFGREEYLNQKNDRKFATKCFYFRSVEKIQSGVDVPEDRLLPTSIERTTPEVEQDGFMNIPDGLQEELPFD